MIASFLHSLCLSFVFVLLLLRFCFVATLLRTKTSSVRGTRASKIQGIRPSAASILNVLHSLIPNILLACAHPFRQQHIEDTMSNGV
jgi:hypothetical protein